MKIDTMVPIYVLDGEVDLPESGSYYVVASNGVFLHKDNSLMRTSIQVQGPSPLEEYNVESSIGHSLPKINSDICFEIKTFFAKVVEEMRSESCVMLFYNKITQHYVFAVPPQTVSHAGVNYLREALTDLEELDGYIPVGTIHSHCDFQAYHSGVDDRDEVFFDGLHITFGHNDRKEFTISASIVMNARRVQIDPESILEGITSISGDIYTLDEHPEEFIQAAQEKAEGWLDQILSRSDYEELIGNQSDETGN